MLTLKGVDHIIHTPRPNHVLKNIDLQINANEIVGIMGRLGAGKTTLACTLNILNIPTHGSVYFEGIPLLEQNASHLQACRRKIGFLKAPYELLHTKNLAQNIALPLVFAGFTKKETESIIDYVLMQMGLSEFRNAYPHQLNAVQKRRACLARAIATKPKILIWDEPTFWMDNKSSQALQKLLKEIQEELQLSMVLTTQDMDVIKNICDKVAILHQGEITEFSTVLELFSNPKSEAGKDFVKSSSRLDLPSTLRKKLRPHSKEGLHPIFRVSFLGRNAKESLIAHVIQGLGLIVNITQAYLETIQDQVMGIMILEMKGKSDSIDRATQFLTEKGLHIEVLGYVPDAI